MRSAIILAAGKGTRMKSSLNKVMHPILNKPMIGHIVSTLKKANVENIMIIVGYEANQIKDYFKAEVTYALQEPQLGTGHAVMQAQAFKGFDGETLVLNGDGPLIQLETILAVYESNKDASATVLTSVLEDGAHYGRIVRNKKGHVDRIVEAKDASDEEKEIKEINTGIFCFKNKQLFEGLSKITNNNAQNEYYLTDLVEIFCKEGKVVKPLVVNDGDEAMGINDRVELAKANTWMKRHVNTMHMKNGVTILDPNNTYIDVDVTIGQDTILYPNVTICKGSIIENNVTILPNSFIENSTIKEGTIIDSSKIIDSVIGKQVTIGPMSHVRNHTVIHDQVRIGNFVEFKNSNFGEGSKCAHLSYIGDSDFGKNINVGCGVVTVNYDGKSKYRTTVDDGAFIGSNCNLIAPIHIGENALLAAGSTITDNVDTNDMGIARAKQVNKEGFGLKYKRKGDN